MSERGSNEAGANCMFLLKRQKVMRLDEIV
jgi:hypothetical protein